MKIHVTFTCRQWVSIDDPSVPLNVIWVHVNANHRQAQYSLPVHDGLKSAAIMTAVKTHLNQCLSISVSLEFRHSSVLYRSVTALLIVSVGEANRLGPLNERDAFELN